MRHSFLSRQGLGVALMKASATVGLKNNSLVLLNQIRTIDKARLVKRLGTSPAPTLSQVSTAIEISLDTVGI